MASPYAAQAPSPYAAPHLAPPYAAQAPSPYAAQAPSPYAASTPYADTTPYAAPAQPATPGPYAAPSPYPTPRQYPAAYAPGNAYSPVAGYGAGGAYPPAPGGPDRFAVIALILAVVGILAVPIIPAVVLAVLALRRIRRTGGPGTGMAVTAIVVAGTWAVILVASGVYVALNPEPSRSAAGTVTSEGRVNPRKLQVGDCILRFDTAATVATVQVVPCAQPHAGQVIGRFTLDEGSYPGVKKIEELANNRCAGHVPSRLGSAQGDDLSVAYFYPQPSNWAVGDRAVSCLVISEGKPLTGKLGD